VNRGHGRSELARDLRPREAGRGYGGGWLFVLHDYRRMRPSVVDVQNGRAHGGAYGVGVRLTRQFQRSNAKCESFVRVRHHSSSRSLVGADESYRVDDALEEGMTPVLELPPTMPPDRIAGAVGVLARAIARQIVDEIGAKEKT